MVTPATDAAMYRTIHRQPQDLRRILGEGWEGARQGADILRGARRVFLVGIGTSYHAALVGSWLFRAAAKDARAISSFDFATYPEATDLQADDAVIVMAHTGVKRYSTDAMTKARDVGAPVISVGSLTAEHPGSQLVLRTVERERSSAFTSSHLAAMTVLAQIATEMGEAAGVGVVRAWRSVLQDLPDQVAEIIEREDDILPIARLAKERRVYAAGAGPNEATALEVVIKVREAAYGHIDGLAIEQFLHGPMVAVNAGDLAILINVPGRAEKRTSEIAGALAKMGADLWLVGQGVERAPEAAVFTLPEIPELLSPLPAVVPMQILAFQMAALKGVNPDTFRRDNPIYAEAWSTLHL